MSPERERLIEEWQALGRKAQDMKNQMLRVEKTIPGLAWQLYVKIEDMHTERDKLGHRIADLQHYEQWTAVARNRIEVDAAVERARLALSEEPR